MEVITGNESLLVLLMIGSVIIVHKLISSIIQRKMKADKTTWFSNPYFNDFHRQAGIILNFLLVFAFFCIFTFGEVYPVSGSAPLMLVILPIVGLTVYMEWRHAENRANYKASLLNVAFSAVFAGIFMLLGIQIIP
ncbi:DUF4181 domain-containing protein [Salibacterium halotolerans]|uniref:DUF4181 domain-containing protein n=1 Tax=Salibacterium halotolerans TaxID=1884432 RepID=A0A1I5S7A8_9BACI|nr:DUF4181 domain-containing protein [Salibacterium halotolerans]SFP66517.1 protein of unknown function [Salibacterium halotolerans]